MFSLENNQLIFNIKDDLIAKKSVFQELINIKDKLTFNKLLNIYRNVFVLYETGIIIGQDHINFTGGGLMSLKISAAINNNFAQSRFDNDKQFISYELSSSEIATQLEFVLNGYQLKLYPFLGKNENQINKISFMFAKDNWANTLINDSYWRISNYYP